MILRKILTVLLEMRDLLKLIEGNTSAAMLTIDLISRNPKLQPLVATHNAPAESAPVQKASVKPYKVRSRKGKPSEFGFATITDLARHFKMSANELKEFCNANDIKYGTYCKHLWDWADSNYIKPEGIEKLNNLLSTIN